ncbi:MAG: alpha/beta hydrolase [Gemmatimonadaceae bacterium]
MFDNGFGEPLETWDPVVADVALFARVVTYDRAEIGKSEKAAEPRSFRVIATELHTLLHRTNIAPPYVLVGHSMGGANIRAFALLYKDEVAALVFVDPFSESVFRRLGKRERDSTAIQLDSARTARAGKIAESTLIRNETLNDFPELTSFGKPPEVPMMLLIAGKNRPAHWSRSVMDQYGAWMFDATMARIIYTSGAGHYIHRDDPALVVDAIHQTVRMLSGSHE